MSKLKYPELEHEAIADARRRATDREHAWLRKRGWTYTSSTPGCYWMWLKEWQGKTFLVDTSTAARIQEYWDEGEDADKHPEKYED